LHSGGKTFSILSRIVGAATNTDQSAQDRSNKLSVSSVGSWALQHNRHNRHNRWRNHLSVSSVGSWALQLF